VVVAMSLSAREQQALGRIEDRLAAADPKLASLLATFTELASGDEMPVREKIRAGWRRASWRRRRQHRSRDRVRRLARSVPGRRGWQWVMLMLGLATVVAVTAVALIVNRGGPRGVCRASWAVACVQQTPRTSRAATAPKAAAGRAPGERHAVPWQG
jgi:hypothetical protein